MVTAAMAMSWALLTVHLRQLTTDALSHRLVHRRNLGRRRRWTTAPAPHDDDHEQHATQEGDIGNDPHEQGEPTPGRSEQDPFAVLVDEVGLDLVRGLSRRQALADDTSHLMRRLGWRVRNGEALTHDAAELGGDLSDGVLLHRRRCG